eukprot:9927478-Alexandrium_andersonii.AAC.1
MCALRMLRVACCSAAAQEQRACYVLFVSATCWARVQRADPARRCSIAASCSMQHACSMARAVQSACSASWAMGHGPQASAMIPWAVGRPGHGR